MVKSKSKKITIEKLAEMINNGFEKTATKEQFEKLEVKVDKMDNRLKKLEEALEID